VSTTLKNKRILITRPQHQANQLSELIKEKGGDVILFPTIEIRPVLKSEKLVNCFANINNYDLLIFISRNAVTVTFENYLEPELITTVKVMAIGVGTMSALSELKLNDVLHAGEQGDSESLLQLSELQESSVQNKNILIIRGIGGRELLADSLRKRGAVVEYAEVYQRCLPEYEIQQCDEIWQNQSPDAVIVSSNEGLTNLLKLTTKENQIKLFNTPLVVMSNRNAKLAKQSGFVSDTGIAKSKNDEGLLSALLDVVGDE
jgi:uroporphyrinogen-III synthase